MTEQDHLDLEADMAVLARHGAGLDGDEQGILELSTGFVIITRDEAVERLATLLTPGC